MKALYFLGIGYGGVADLCDCLNCDNGGGFADAMLLPTGTDTCPICHAVGCLAWHDDRQEVEVSEFFVDNDIIFHKP
ncbi:MAG: hypothetical protein J6Y37_11485 [Paludibacteraceae bacterium]|nr:hypothetical protein [Paludibacteraceae bacterium]